MDERTAWLMVFDRWLVERLSIEFSGSPWTFQVIEREHLITAGPRGLGSLPVVVPLPTDYMHREPYLVAAIVARKIRAVAMTQGLAEAPAGGASDALQAPPEIEPPPGPQDVEPEDEDGAT